MDGLVKLVCVMVGTADGGPKGLPLEKNWYPSPPAESLASNKTTSNLQMMFPPGKSPPSSALAFKSGV